MIAKRISKIIALVLIGALIGSSLTLFFSSKQNQEKELSPKLLKEDIEFLVKKLERIHPNPYAYTNKTKVYEMKEDLLQSINHPLTPFEFYKKICPLVTTLHDEHTYVNFVWPPDARFFPLSIRVLERGQIFIAEDCGDIPKGSEVLTINGIEIDQLTERVRKWINYHTELSFLFGLENCFQGLLYLELGNLPNYEVKIRGPDNQIKKVEVESITPAKMSKKEVSMWSIPWSFETIESDIGYLRLRQMRYDPTTTYKPFLKGAFAELKEKEIENLIIDIRGNPGGADFTWYLLLPYIADKNIIEEILPPDVSGLLIKYNILSEEEVKTWLNPPFKFKGDTYLLIDRDSFSSAAGLAACFKHYHLGPVLGEETGQPIPSYGSTKEFNLPNSKLQVGCSTEFVSYFPGPDTGRGVNPDYEVKLMPEDLITGKDRVIEFALELIRAGY